MFKCRAMLVALLLAGPLSIGIGQRLPPAMPLDQNHFPATEAALHEYFPAYVGFEVYAGTLYLAVDTHEQATQQDILQRVQAVYADFLPSFRAKAGQAVILQGLPKSNDLVKARAAAGNIRGWNFIQSDTRISRVVVGLNYPSQRDEAEETFRLAGVSPDAYLIVSLPPVPLPTGPVLAGSYSANLAMPATVPSGEQVPVTLQLRNTGTQDLNLEYGECDFWFEIWNVKTGELVRGRPWREVCSAVGYSFNLAARTQKDLAQTKWTAETTDWKPLPSGTYELRAVFGTASQARAARATSRGYIIPAPVSFRVVPKDWSGWY